MLLSPTELIGDGEERFGSELLVCVVARLLFRSPVVDAALLAHGVLPRLLSSCPVLEELPGQQVDGEDADEQNGFEEESADEGEGEPGDDGAGGFDHVVAGDELRSQIGRAHV